MWDQSDVDFKYKKPSLLGYVLYKIFDLFFIFCIIVLSILPFYYLYTLLIK
jgi:hypothetical protein